MLHPCRAVRTHLHVYRSNTKIWDMVVATHHAKLCYSSLQLTPASRHKHSLVASNEWPIHHGHVEIKGWWWLTKHYSGLLGGTLPEDEQPRYASRAVGMACMHVCLHHLPPDGNWASLETI